VLFGPWAFVATALAIIGFILTFYTPLEEHDYWWHLAVGRYIIAHAALPAPDVFSYTAAGRAWIAPARATGASCTSRT